MKKLGIKKGPEAKHYLQNYVTARVQKFLNDHGRKIIGWDEILEGDLAEGATVMSWRGTKGGIKAASMGFDVVMTPTDYAYFDYYQSKERDKEPFGIGGYLPLGSRKLGTFGYSVMKPKTQKKKAAESRKMSLMKKKSKHSAPKKKESVFTGKSRLVSKD